ncbi:hypothetical protein HELRODRAFT_166549 [Helobdella robusta]|uniref:Uncharacterized protein n=1 Tax=Helobdella robusta TaxID=6412 RepID=T1EY84_HELRO|nr:hypothetical protein HELRODRAFT_166549 [Helobdella robusta]ESO11548.1 hypothetical protein HELRODRAFT_166549 [Helobdella robusta]
MLFLNCSSDMVSNTALHKSLKLIDRANEWMKKNPDSMIKSCETLTWMGSDPCGMKDGERMMVSKKLVDGATTVFLRGLRLWLVPRTCSKQQVLHFEDFTPAEHEKLDQLVGRINRKIEHKHIAGKILSIETLNVPVSKSKVRNHVTVWTEDVELDTPYAFILRVFFNRESVRQLGKINLTLGPHEDLGKSLFYSMPGINNFDPVEFFRILRIYTLKIKPPSNKKLTKKSSNDTTTTTTTGNSVTTATNNDNHNGGTETDKLKMNDDDDDDDEDDDNKNNLPHVLPVCCPFIYETFTPELMRERDSNAADLLDTTTTTPTSMIVKGTNQQIPLLLQSPQPQHLITMERLEEMRETFSKVIAFLRNSGADVLGAETVMNPMQLYCDEAGQDDEMKFLFTIRLYLTGQISQLMNGNTLAIKRVTSSTNLNNNNNGFGDSLLKVPGAKKHRPSPLFLRSVVSRQYKYRWLVLAISAFTCMTIIVVVSVVYSSKLW